MDINDYPNPDVRVPDAQILEGQIQDDQIPNGQIHHEQIQDGQTESGQIQDVQFQDSQALDDISIQPPDEHVAIKQEPAAEEAAPWKFDSGELINLLSEDEDGDMDMTGPGVPNLASPMDHPSNHEAATNEVNLQVTKPSQPNMSREQMLKLQKQFADKFREKKATSDAVSGFNPRLKGDDSAKIAQPSGEDHIENLIEARSKDQGNDDAAAQFEKVKKQYLRKKRANTLSIEEEIEWIKLESEEVARRRKVEADAEYNLSPTPEPSEALFISDSEDRADAFRAVEPEERKARARKRPRTQDEAEETAPRKRTKLKAPISGGRKGRKGAAATDGLDDFDSLVEKARKKTAAKEKTKKTNTTKANGNKKALPPMANMSSIMGTDVFEDYARTAQLANQPSFDPTGRRAEALKQLIASVPTEDKKAAGSDKKLLEKCIKSFAGHESSSVGPADDGNWKVKGMKSTLKHYQVLGTGFLRDRENASQQPKGGILADVMGFGKTVMMLANIVNSKPVNRKKRHQTTLIVASPSILTQVRFANAANLRPLCANYFDSGTKRSTCIVTPLARTRMGLEALCSIALAIRRSRTT